MTPSFRVIARLTVCALTWLFVAFPAESRYIGGQPPAKRDCPACTKCKTCNTLAPCGCSLSNTEGNLRDGYRAGITIKSAFGPTLDFALNYNSMAADGSQSRTNTGHGLRLDTLLQHPAFLATRPHVPDGWRRPDDQVQLGRGRHLHRLPGLFRDPGP